MRAKLAAALQCIRSLAPFDARLSGVLATGVDQPAIEPIHIVAIAEHADAIGAQLQSMAIPARMVERKLEVPRSAPERVSGYAFLAGEHEFRIWVLNEAQSRQRLRFLSDPCVYPRLTAQAIERRLAESA